MVFIFLWILPSFICEYLISLSREVVVIQLLILIVYYSSGFGFIEIVWRVIVLRGSKESRLNFFSFAMGMDILRRLFLSFL